MLWIFSGDTFESLDRPNKFIGKCNSSKLTQEVENLNILRPLEMSDQWFKVFPQRKHQAHAERLRGKFYQNIQRQF